MTEKEPKINGPRRIFCVITQGELGGAQQFVAQLAKNLDPERFKLHVVWGESSGNTLARLLPPQVTYSTVRHLVRGWSVWHDTKAIFELRRQIRAERPDVVLCISSKAGFVGSRAAHLLRREIPNIKIVYRIGGWAFNDPLPAWKRQFYVLLEKISARWKDTIVLNNTHDFEQAHLLHIRPRKNLLRIYNGIDPYMPFLPQEQAQAFLRSRLPHDASSTAPIVGTIANLYATKDIPMLLRAAAQTGDALFVVIGDGPQRAQIERNIDSHGLRNRFFLLGRIANAWQYVTGFDIFALASAKEGFPWALLEAMAAKVPAIATKVGAVQEMLDDGVSGIVCEPGNAEQFAKGISQLLNSEELRQSFAINAHQQVLTKFSIRDMLAQYEKLFTE
jgi:glycosyltransferase involved in cell wall biosynthesis